MGVNVSIIVPVVIGVLVILLCVVFHVLKYYYKNIRRPSRVIRTGGSADVRVIEYLTATPPEYNDALNMRPTVQTISGTVDETQPQITLPHSDLQRDARPPSYGTATSGLFQLTLDNGCPTPHSAGTPDMRSNHLDREEERREVHPDQGHHNPAFISDEDSSTPRTPPPNYDELATDAGSNHIDREEEHREVEPGLGHHNPAFVPDDNNSTPRTPPPNYDGLATDARSNHINREEEHTEVDPGPGHHNPAFVPEDNNSTPRTPPPNYDGLATDGEINHIDREEEHTEEYVPGPEHHNPTSITDEDSSIPRTPPPNYDGLETVVETLPS